MSRLISGVVVVVLMVVVIVGADVFLFKNRLEAKFLANIGIVLVFAALYLRFRK